MKNLVVGKQEFRTLIEDNIVYVDKTKYIYELIKTKGHYFLSRPRRFGKTLLVNTMKELFLGNKHLFKETWVYDKVEFKKYPVISLSFNSLNYKELGLKKELAFVINKNAEANNIDLKQDNYVKKFEELIEKLSEKEKVVILIDEYDKPIIDYITDPDKAAENRDILKEFYSIFKAKENCIKFLFITGVSKFSKISIFSDLNHLRDITLDKHFSMIAGYTIEEIKNNYKDHIELAKKSLELSNKEFFEKLKLYYNGYSWDGKFFLYNPFSVISFLAAQEFKNYWFATGTPTLLIDYFKKYKKDLINFEEIKVFDDFFDKFEIDNMEIEHLFFQTGYLTIKKVEPGDFGSVYTLSFPNKEVKNAFLKYFFEKYAKKKSTDTYNIVTTLKDSLENNKPDIFIETLDSLFSSIPYSIFEKEYESYYHSIVYAILKVLGINIQCEISTNKGRIDVVIKTHKYVYIIEFKVDEKIETGFKQILEKEYYKPYLNSDKQIITGVINFSKETKNVKDAVFKNLEDLLKLKI